MVVQTDRTVVLERSQKNNALLYLDNIKIGLA